MLRNFGSSETFWSKRTASTGIATRWQVHVCTTCGHEPGMELRSTLTRKSLTSRARHLKWSKMETVGITVLSSTLSNPDPPSEISGNPPHHLLRTILEMEPQSFTAQIHLLQVEGQSRKLNFTMIPHRSFWQNFTANCPILMLYFQRLNIVGKLFGSYLSTGFGLVDIHRHPVQKNIPLSQRLPKRNGESWRQQT